MKASTLTKNKQFIRKLAIIFIWVMVWEWIHHIVGKDILIPSPYATFKKLIEMMKELGFYYDIFLTFYRVGMGVIISSLLGFGTGLIAYLIKPIQELLEPFMTLLKSTPVMAVIILALLWFTKNTVPIFVCLLMCYPVVYTNVLKGFQSVDQELLEMAKTFRVKTFVIVRELYIPQVKPYLDAALCMIVGLAWKVVVAAEVLAVPNYSMGYNLLSAKSYLETETLFAWVVVIVILSSLCESSVKWLLQRENRQDGEKR